MCGVLFLLVDNILRNAFQFVFIILLAKTQADSELGDFGVATTIVTPIAMLSALQLRTIAATESPTGCGLESTFLLVRIAANVFLICSAFLLAFAAGYNENVILITVLLSALRGVELTYDLYFGFMQRLASEKTIAKLSAAKNGVAIVVGLVLGSMGCRVPLLIGGVCIATVLLGLAIYILRGKESSDHSTAFKVRSVTTASRATVLRLLLLALPFALISAVVSATSVVPRLLLPAQEIGGFVAIASVFAALTAAFGVIGQSLATKTAQQFRDGECAALVARAKTLSALGVFCAAPVFFLGVWQAEFFLQVLFNGTVAKQANVLRVFAAGTFVSFPLVQLSWLLLASRSVVKLGLCALCNFIVVIVAALIVVPIFSSVGLAIAILIGSIATLLLSFLLLRAPSKKGKLSYA